MRAASVNPIAAWAERAKIRERFSGERIGGVSQAALRALAASGLGLVALAFAAGLQSVIGPAAEPPTIGLPLLAGSVALFAGFFVYLVALSSTGVVITDRSVVVLQPFGHTEYSLTKETRFSLSSQRRVPEIRLGPYRTEPIPELGKASLSGGGRLRKRVALANSTLERHLLHPPQATTGDPDGPAADHLEPLGSG